MPSDARRGPSLSSGFRVGHWTEASRRTGCTVVLPPPGNVASCAVRGSSPSTRELEHLDPARKLTEVHGVLLTGGSAFGLAAAQGVVEWLEERGIGYQTPLVPVPIVPAAVIFDAAAPDSRLRPGPEAGRSACETAAEGEVPVGRVGAGAGATVGKWAGREFAAPGGLGTARAEDEDGLVVGALAVVNAVGDVVDDAGEVVAGTSAPDPSYSPPPPRERDLPANTVLAVATTDARVDKRQAKWLAERASDGITVSVRPAHTRYDGDATFFLSGPPSDVTEPVDAVGLDVLGFLATRAVAAAVRNAVQPG